LLNESLQGFVDSDMSLLEINPLIITKDKKLLCSTPRSASTTTRSRHPDVAALRDETEEDAKEIEASKYDLNYVALDGEMAAW